ncbi:MAG: DUF805 domain-containing protein [Clostridiales bacterium]|jgi:uncharacterized membrane protein YhaH (DUF805 family)|nr:DUF805 domain-containing protein [Clostridiales bacterium]
MGLKKIQNTYFNVFQKDYFNFSGTVSNYVYAVFAIVSIIIWIALGTLTGILRNISVLGWILSTLTIVVFIFLAIPFVALTVRRLHAFRLSGLWALLLLIPLVNLVMVIYLIVVNNTVSTSKKRKKPVKKSAKKS